MTVNHIPVVHRVRGKRCIAGLTGIILLRPYHFHNGVPALTACRNLVGISIFQNPEEIKLDKEAKILIHCEISQLLRRAHITGLLPERAVQVQGGADIGPEFLCHCAELQWISYIPELGRLPLEGAPEDGGEHFQMVFKKFPAPGSGRGRGDGFLQISVRKRCPAGHLLHRKYRRDESQVRFYVTVKLFFPIGLRTDTHAVGHEKPHVDGEVVYIHIILADIEAELELNRETVVFLCLYCNHCQNNSGVYPSQWSTVSPQRRMRTQDITIIIMPNLNVSVQLYWLVL